jgi:fluoride exporter
VLAVALGGAAGASGRWLVGSAWDHPGTWPWPTFTVNVVGCLLLGVIAARLPFVADQVALWRDGLATGFCGGLTTFSTFAVEAAELIRDDRAGVAAAYLTASLAAGWATFELGRRAAHRRVARRSPRPTAGVRS